MHKRPKDPVELAALVEKIAAGDLPNDKDEILNPPLTSVIRALQVSGSHFISLSSKRED